MATSVHEILLNVASDSDDAQRDLLAFGAEVEALDGIDAEAELRLDDSKFNRGVAAAEAKARALGAQRIVLEVDVDSDPIEQAAERIATAVEGMGSGGGGGGDPGGILGFFSSMGGRVQLLLRLLPLLIPLVVSLGAGIVALGASLGGAVLGLGALGVAAGAALGPVAALGIGAVQRFTSAKTAAEQLRQAQVNVKTAAEAQRDAEDALANAQRNADQAQRALVTARREAAQQARDDYAAALDQLRQAEASHDDAVYSATQAQQALTQAREDATRALVDQRLAAEGAALSEREAVLALNEARRRLKEVEADPTSSIHDQREAKLAVERAELGLKSAREQNKRSQDDLNEAERKGVEGSDQVLAAKHALAEANQQVADTNRDVADAATELARVQRAAQRPAEQVVAAQQALRDANNQVDAANRNLTVSTQRLNRARHEQNKLERESAALAKGTAGRRLLQTGRRFGRQFNRMIADASDAIYNGISRALDSLSPVLKRLEDEFTGLGEAIGDAFAQWGEELARPRWVSFFEDTIDAASRIVPDLTRIGINFARILRNIAQAAMPFFEGGVESLADWTGGLAKATGDAEKTSSVIGGLIGHLKSWLSLIGELGEALFNIGSGAAGQGQSWVDDMGDSLRSWNEWASSDEGQARIREFFDRMVPLARSLLKAIGKLGKVLLGWAELAAPALTPLLNILADVLDVAAKLVDKLNDLPGILGDIASGAAGLTVLRQLWKVMRGGKGGGAPVPVPTGTGKGGWLSKLKTGISQAGGWIKGLALTGAGAIGSKLLPALGRIGPSLLRIAGPAGIALGAVFEWGDDLGRAFASVAGYSDDAIRNAQQVADAEGRLADKLSDINTVLRNLNDHGFRIKHAERLYQILTPAELDRAEKIAARGGDVTATAFWKSAVREFRNGRDRIAGAAKTAAEVGADAAAKVRGKFRQAGVGLGESLEAGLRSVIRKVSGAVRDVAQAMRNLLNGSEPRDKSSPLTRLDLAGEAFVDNYTRGLRRAAHRATAAVRRDLAGGLTGNLGAAIGPGRGGNVDRRVTNNLDMHLNVVGGGSPDARATVDAITLGLARKGLSVAG